MEQRKEPRYSLTCEVEAIPSVSGDARKISRAVQGRVINISAGGAYLLSERPLERLSVLTCRFHFPGVPVSVPILVQVRWTELLDPGNGAFRVGLKFLL